MNQGRPPGPFVLRKSDAVHMDQLPQRLAAALRLVHQGMSYRDASAALAIPINTVKTRVHRAREKIIHLRGAAALVAAIKEDEHGT
jgi:transposase-like protein